MRARGRAGLVAAALALTGVLILAVFPTRAWMAQRQHRREVAAQVAVLEARNRALQERAATLRSDDAEIERLARQYNLVRPGEEVYFIPPEAAPPAPVAAVQPPPDDRSRPWWSRAWAKITSLF